MITCDGDGEDHKMMIQSCDHHDYNGNKLNLSYDLHLQNIKHFPC